VRIPILVILALGTVAPTMHTPASHPGPRAPVASRRLAPADSASDSTSQYVLVIGGMSAAGGFSQSPLYAADLITGETASGVAASSLYVVGSGFTGAVQESLITTSVPPAAPAPARFRGLRLSRRAGALAVSFVVHSPGPCALAVYDVAGRVVGQYRDDRPVGLATLWWDGRDASGGLASSGIYFVRVAWDGGAATSRTVWLR